MRRRVAYAVSAGVGALSMPGVVFAQDEPGQFEPIINWVFYLAIIIGVGFAVFVAFAVVYYVLAVVARGRRYAAPSAAAPAQSRAPAAAAAPAQAAPAAAPAQAAPAAAPAQAPAQQAAAQAPAAEPAQQAPAAEAPAQAPAEQAPTAPAAAPADGGGLPKIDPMNLPDGVDAVTRGRLKKLAVLQERGKAPPAELVEQLKPVLEELGGGPIDVAAATSAPAQAAPQAPAEQAPAPQAPSEAPAAEAPAAEEPKAEEAAPASEEAPAQEAAAQEAPAQEAPAPQAPAADTGDLPRIDPMNLPDGIDAVTRGRLKKLAIFQERGQAPPADLVEQLRSVLDRMKES